MQTETTNLPAINVQEFQKIVGEAPAILDKNKNSLANAKKVGTILFDYIEKDGMSDHYDAELNKYIGKLKTTLNNMNAARKPFTQLVDSFKKMFTQAEADLKPLHDKAQNLRNEFATRKMEEQRKKEEEAQRKLDQERERIEIKKRVAIILSEKMLEITRKAKEELGNILENSTLETLEEARETIAGFPISTPKETFDGIEVKITPLHLPADEVQSIIKQVKDSTYIDENSNHQTAIVSYKRELIDKVPSKKAELEELAKADAAEAERLKAEADKRKKEEAERLDREEEEARRRAEEEANLKATAEATDAMVNSQAEMSFSEKPKVKEGYEIILRNTAAFLVLAQFWYDKEGKAWTVDKVEKMTFARIKKFCEDYAVKHEEKVNSPFVEYKEIFKAK
jgi:hypothetical protein